MMKFNKVANPGHPNEQGNMEQTGTCHLGETHTPDVDESQIMEPSSTQPRKIDLKKYENLPSSHQTKPSPS